MKAINCILLLLLMLSRVVLAADPSNIDNLITVHASGFVQKKDGSEVAFVKLILKNTSKFRVGLEHVHTYYRNNLELRFVDQRSSEESPMPFPMAGNGSAKWIEPGETFEFQVDVPLDVFKQSTRKFVAKIKYFARPNDETFYGYAASAPFGIQREQ